MIPRILVIRPLAPLSPVPKTPRVVLESADPLESPESLERDPRELPVVTESPVNNTMSKIRKRVAKELPEVVMLARITVEAVAALEVIGAVELPEAEY